MTMDSATPQHSLGGGTDCPSRTVRGFRFSVLPCLEGRWSGTARRAAVPPVEEPAGAGGGGKGGGGGGDTATSSPPPSCPWPSSAPLAASTKVAFVEGEEADGGGGYWTLRETQAASDGMSAVVLLKLIPIADGQLLVEPMNHGSAAMKEGSLPFSSMDVRLMEKSFGAQLVGHSAATRELEVCWVVKFTQKGEMERTILSYGKGLLSSVCHVLERRVK